MIYRLVYYFPSSVYTVNRYAVEFEVRGTTSSSRVYLAQFSIIEFSIHTFPSSIFISTTFFDSVNNELVERSRSSVYPITAHLDPIAVINWQFTLDGDATFPLVLRHLQTEYL